MAEPGATLSGTRSDHPKTADKLATWHGVSREAIKRDGAFAEAVGRVKGIDLGTASGQESSSRHKRYNYVPERVGIGPRR